ncbi:UNVERIFIED_CONTAM: hypothetical protein FKN15_021208 [Acipenser sinensis]
MDRNALAELLQALESRRDAEERRREERYTALIERAVGMVAPPPQALDCSSSSSGCQDGSSSSSGCRNAASTPLLWLAPVAVPQHTGPSAISGGHSPLIFQPVPISVCPPPFSHSPLSPQPCLGDRSIPVSRPILPAGSSPWSNG